jgi:hypothetical protein
MMKKLHLSHLLSALMFLCAIGTIGCGGEGNTPYSPIISGTTGTPAPDFSLSVAPASATIVSALLDKAASPMGASTSSHTFTITVAGTQGFNGPVNLSVDNPAPANFTTAFDHTSVHLSGTSPQVAHLTIARATAHSPRDFIFPITASGGGVSHTFNVTIHLVAPSGDFSVEVIPAEQAVPVQIKGASHAAFDIRVSTVNGFTGTVNLVQAGLPAQTFQANFVAGSTATLTANTNVVDVPMVVDVNAAQDFTNYPFTVTGTSNGKQHVANGQLDVNPDESYYLMNANPSSATITLSQTKRPPGQIANTVTSSIEVSGVNGYSATVALTLQNQVPGFTATLNKTSVTLSQLIPDQSATLSVHLLDATKRGTFYFFVKGTASNKQQLALFAVTVQ